MTFTDYRTSVKPVYTQLKIKNLTEIYKIKLATLAHKHININGAFSNFHRSNRRPLQLNLPVLNNNYGLHSISVNIIKAYNSLPLFVKILPHDKRTIKLIKNNI